MTKQYFEWNSDLQYWTQIQVETESAGLKIIFIIYIHLFPAVSF